MSEVSETFTSSIVSQNLPDLQDADSKPKLDVFNNSKLLSEHKLVREATKVLLEQLRNQNEKPKEFSQLLEEMIIQPLEKNHRQRTIDRTTEVTQELIEEEKSLQEEENLDELARQKTETVKEAMAEMETAESTLPSIVIQEPPVRAEPDSDSTDTDSDSEFADTDSDSAFADAESDFDSDSDLDEYEYTLQLPSQQNLLSAEALMKLWDDKVAKQKENLLTMCRKALLRPLQRHNRQNVINLVRTIRKKYGNNEM